MTDTLDDLIHTALKSGKNVEIELAEKYGYQFVVDGVKIPEDGKEGAPHEIFGYKLSNFSNSDCLEEKLEDLRTNTGDEE